MLDMFSREGNELGGIFSADGARVSFSSGISGAGGAVGGPADAASVSEFQTGLIVQSVQITYRQQLSRIYEIGSKLTFLIAGRTSGDLQLASVLGPRPISTAFYTKYGNVCNAATNIIVFEAAANCVSGDISQTVVSQNQSGGTFRFIVRSVVLSQYSLSVVAQEMVFNEQLAGMFISLELSA